MLFQTFLYDNKVSNCVGGDQRAKQAHFLKLGCMHTERIESLL